MKYFFLLLPLFSFSQFFDIEGHRGCRGLMPENTVPAFIKALDIGVTTLEMDLAVSKDNQLIVSHDPWIDDNICVCKERIAIGTLTATEIQQFDCGSKPNSHFPNQLKMIVHKPLLSEVVDSVEQYIKEKHLPAVHYNIEIKSKPEWDNVYTPDVNVFAKQLVDFIHLQNNPSLFIIQSFDSRALEAVHKLDSTIATAWLFPLPDGWKTGFEKLSFRSAIMSPYSLMTNRTQIVKAHKLGMKVIPWTVNDEKSMQKYIAMGVDGLITDYPDMLKRVLQTLPTERLVK